MSTTSASEWAFVCNDEIVGFPREVDWLADPAKQFKLRVKRGQAWLMTLLEAKNGTLKSKGFTPLLLEELIAARLYTGIGAQHKLPPTWCVRHGASRTVLCRSHLLLPSRVQDLAT